MVATVQQIVPAISAALQRQRLGGVGRGANQVIEKELEDGGLIVSAKAGHVNHVLPIVR